MTYDETSTVAASANGRIQSSVPPRRRNTSPAALPTATFIKRHLNRRRASSGSGSEAATIDAMAQIGLRSPIACRTFQTIVVASSTLMAKRSPTRCSDDSPNRFRSASARALRDGASSLVRRGSIAMQPVHDAGLRGVQRNPVLRGVLKRHEERLELLHRVQAQVLAILESDLEGEFADQGAVLSARAPNRDVRFRANPLAKGQHADVLKDFLDNRVAHERDLLAGLLLYSRQHREDLGQGTHGQDIVLVDAGTRKLHVVGVQHADAAELAFEGERLALELDAVVAEDVGPYVGLGRRLQVRVTELEHDLGVADREAVLVADSPAQDEASVVQPEVGRIHEEHFADLNRRALAGSYGESDGVRLGRLTQDLGKIEEALTRPEAVRPENELAAEILHLVQGQTIGIVPRFEERDTTRPRQLSVRILFPLFHGPRRWPQDLCQ